MENDGKIKVKSLHKAIEVLNCFVDKPSLGVTEISEKLGLYKSNVHNILATLTALDYLERDEETERYHLGVGVLMLSRAMNDVYEINNIALPYMQELSNITNERVYLAIPHREEILYLEATYPAESTHLMRSVMGVRAEFHCTGLGKAILANMPSEKIDAYLKRPLQAYTDHTITDPERLREELAATRQRGYAVDDMEHEFGVKCVALPIFDKMRNVYAGISVSGLATHFTDDKIVEWAILMKKYVSKIESRL